MKYTVKFSCGHTHEVELFGANSERERKIAWYEKYGVCPDCYRAQKEERKEAAEDLNLPSLEGSEKQIAWAEKIRADFIKIFEKSVNTYANATQEQREETKKALAAAPSTYNVNMFKKVVAVFEEKSAKWWIENRD